MKRFGILVLWFGVFASLTANAASSYPVFTPDEIATHRANISALTATASQCLTDTYREHVSFYHQWHVSKFYGIRRPELRTENLRRQELRKYGAPESLVSELEAISCIGLTLECLGKGFVAAGQTNTWHKIYSRLAVDNKFLGTDLQKMLIDLGWVSMYWNPDPSQNEAWDREDQRVVPATRGRVWMPVWGGHAARYNTVVRYHTYFNIHVDDETSLVGFKTSPPTALQSVPFFVGTAHAGYHVFPGFDGRVIEAHSMRPLNSFDNLEVSVFNPLAGGGPRWTRSEHYRSGLIVVPPTSH